MSGFTYNIDPHIEHELREYIAGRHPWEFGSFVTALLANDLVEAAGRADYLNVKRLDAYASFLYNEMPGRTGDAARDYWGSYEAVAARIANQRAAAEAIAPAPSSGDRA